MMGQRLPPRKICGGVLRVAGTQGAGHAILVAGTQHGDAGFAGRLPGGAIAHGFAGMDGAGLQDGAFEQGHGLHGIGKCRGGVAAIDGDAGADEIMGVILAQEDAAGIGEAGGNAGEFGCGRR